MAWSCFYNPWALGWLVLLAPLAAACLARVAWPRREVAGAVVWQRVLVRGAGRLLWNRHRQTVSLTLYLAAVVLMVVAAAEPLLSEPERVVLILDNAVPAGRSEESTAWLAALQRRAHAAVDRLAARDEMAILSVGGGLQIECRLSGDPESLDDAIDRAPSAAEPARLAEAVQWARRILGGDRPPSSDDYPRRAGKIVLVTGEESRQDEALATAEDIEWTLPGATETSGSWCHWPWRPGSAGPWLVATVGLILVVEWRLFQRRWTC